jgi:hypothetical protein
MVEIANRVILEDEFFLLASLMRRPCAGLGEYGANQKVPQAGALSRMIMSRPLQGRINVND